MEHQLKENKNIHSTNHILTKLTKFSELTGLQWSAAWTSYKNCTPTSLFSLIFSNSFLSLLPSVNPCALLIYCYNSSCFDYHFEGNLSFCHSLVTATFVGKMKQLSKQPEAEEISSTCSCSSKVFSSDPSSASISISSETLMFYLGSPQVSYFDRSNMINL